MPITRKTELQDECTLTKPNLFVAASASITQSHVINRQVVRSFDCCATYVQLLKVSFHDFMLRFALNVQQLSMNEANERFTSILESARGPNLTGWSVRTATRAYGWAQYVESNTPNGQRRKLLSTLLFSKYLKPEIQQWVEAAYLSSDLAPFHAHDIEQRDLALQTVPRTENNPTTAIQFLATVAILPTSRQNWLRTKLRKPHTDIISMSEAETLGRAIIEMHVTTEQNVQLAEQCPIEGFAAAREAVNGVKNDSGQKEEVVKWLANEFVQAGPSVWKLPIKLLEQICYYNYTVTVHYLLFLFKKFCYACQVNNVEMTQTVQKVITELARKATWINTLLRQLIGLATNENCRRIQYIEASLNSS